MFAHDAFLRKKVFVTGHTGFKGAWLCEWLLELGAVVTGFSLEPPTAPSLFEQLGLSARLNHLTGDVRDTAALTAALSKSGSDYVFHLAAQPLVRLSYAQPSETFATNVMGTVHVLDALRKLDGPCAAVIVTTDKCYENREWLHGYRETDELGGRDPYSASKAAAEIAVAAYRRSYFDPRSPTPGAGPRVVVASARAGNVIGGGDWAADRIVPDCMRALAAKKPIGIRNPKATRPWQHVLEPLSGYLTLAAAMMHALESRSEELPALCSAFNFGPDVSANRSVENLVDTVLRNWPGERAPAAEAGAVHEAGRLHLSIDKACHLLGWRPRWNFDRAVARTVEWYRAAYDNPARVRERTLGDIAAYLSAPLL